MAKSKQQSNQQRQFGKKDTKVEKKPLIDPRYKNTFWTGVFLVVLFIFFIINNTRDVPEAGYYPPSYDPEKAKQVLSENENKPTEQK